MIFHSLEQIYPLYYSVNHITIYFNKMNGIGFCQKFISQAKQLSFILSKIQNDIDLLLG